ncbi:MAG TPA: DUF2993 domain-containing protein [Armatimonadota bacterium]|jgi:hypothetical protein
MRKCSIWVCGLVLLVGGWGARPAGAEVPRPVTVQAVAQQIETKMRSSFELTNPRIEVVPFDDDSYTQQGRFQWIALSADLVKQENVSSRDFFFKVYDVTLNLDHLFAERILVDKLSSGRSVISARIDETDMNAAIAHGSNWTRNSSIDDMRIEFLDGAVRFTGKYKAFFGSDLEMLGTLSVTDDQAVNFNPTAAKINSIPLPAGPLKGLLKKLNPIFNFNKVPLQPTIETVTVRPGYILLRG